MVPSLDLVVYKLRGRGDQYHHRQTGLPPPPKTVFEYDGSREQWKSSVDGEVAIRHTLARMVAAIVRE